jgi:hypothetical protein
LLTIKEINDKPVNGLRESRKNAPISEKENQLRKGR